MKLRTATTIFVESVRFEPGEVVLDVGCGTGTLAMVAKERVGTTGRVIGIDPSRQMITRARSKAEQASLTIDFQPGVIEQLAFPDHSFDVVLCTWVIHHVPDEIKQQGLSEMARVLKPEGRLLVVDSTVNNLPLKEAGFLQVEAGVIPFRRKQHGRMYQGFPICKSGMRNRDCFLVVRC